MPWDRRGGCRYFYLSTRKQGRPTRLYLGNGPEAEAAAAQVERRKRDRALAREALQDERRRHGEALDALDAFWAPLDVLLRAALYSAGYRLHQRGEWRLRRPPRDASA